MKKLFFLLFLILLSARSISAQGVLKGTAFNELPDPTADTLSDWSAVPKGLSASFVTIDQRFAKHRVPIMAVEKLHTIRGWKGECLSAQVLLWTAQPVADVRVSVGEFKTKGARLEGGIAKARFVRYVMTDEFASGCGYRKPQDFAASLSADMLDDLQQFDVEGKSARPVWITVDIPRSAKAGVYQSVVTVSGKGIKDQKLALNLEVIDRVLPEPSDWTFHLDLWQHPAAVARANQVAMWSDAHFEALRPIMKRLANAGQKVITATLNKDPWNVQTFDPYADMIVWTKNSNGSWQYDYTVFDRWVELMMEQGVKKMINCYSIIPWNNRIHYKDAAKGEIVDVEATPGSTEFDTLWSPFLTDFVLHLRAKGWLEITNIAMDERSPEQMDAAFALLKKVAPELGIAYADNHKTYKRYPDSDDISIAIGHPYSREDLTDRRARGLNSTFYICCSDGFPNQFTFSDPAEAAYLGWYALASGFDGLLRWSYNSWVENPLQDSRFRAWPAGDTYLVYPQNRTSIRFERTLEGVQDYTKVMVVRKELEAKGDRKNLQRLDEAIQKLNNPARTADWNKNLNEAKALLNSL